MPNRMLRDNENNPNIRPTLMNDIWACGMIIYEILTDLTPYENDINPVVCNKPEREELPSRPGPEITESY